MFRILLLSSILWGCVFTAQATTISYDLFNIAGNAWEYTYTIENNTLGTDIEEFTVFFDLGLYENLAVSSTPVNWDAIAIDPDPFIPDDGFYDACAAPPGDFCSTLAGIAPGNTLGGFFVQFDYLGAGIPDSQFFEIVDPNDFTILESGVTSPLGTVPLPPTLWLFGFALTILFGKQRMFAKIKMAN